MNCQFENCNQEAGHDGPHGHSVEGGRLIFAPFGGGEGEVSDWEDSGELCDCCSSPMRLRRYQNGGGQFQCIADGCGQEWIVTKETVSSTIINRLYPSSMTKDSAMYAEFLDDKEGQIANYEKWSKFVGAMTPERAAEIIEARKWLASERESLKPPGLIAKLKRWVGAK